MTECKRLVLLVGSNPLPNYLAAMALKPAKMLQIYSDKTKGLNEVLAERIKLLLPDIQCDEAIISNPYDAGSVNEVLQQLTKEDYLNYTGGTKVMSTHALRVFLEEKHGLASHAFYLDDQNRCFRYADGDVKSYDNLAITYSLDDAFALHGIALCSTDNTANDLDKAVNIWNTYLDNPRKEVGDLTSAIETIAAESLHKLLSKSEAGATIQRGLTCKRGDQEFRISITLVHRHRLRLLQVTSKSEKNNIKRIGFEAAGRAVHVGGDLARPAVLCLGDEKIQETAETELRGIWPKDPTNPTIFGKAAVEEMVTYLKNGTPPSALRDWIAKK